MDGIKLINAIKDELEIELLNEANKEISRALNQMEIDLNHQKHIIIGKLLERCDIIMEEKAPFNDLNIRIVFRNEGK